MISKFGVPSSKFKVGAVISVDEATHVPVLVRETVDLLQPQPGGRFIDCTAGGGGHSAAILDLTSPDGALLALDADPAAVADVRARLAPYGDRAQVAHANFRSLREVAERRGFAPVDGVLMDLGLSSRQLEAAGRGFSFSRDDLLDMRYDPTVGRTAAEYLASASEEEIELALRSYGEEPRANRIAREIVAARDRAPMATTAQLAALVRRAVGGRRGRIHPATRTFQALRIAVNQELDALAEALPQAVDLLRRGGRLAVICFHSLEDRIVKNFMRRLAGRASEPTPRGLPLPPLREAPTLRIVTPRPLSPSAEEVAANPRSRSARLRVAERL